jgi:uncharacterized protein YheU (UPF0270 family)
MSAREQVNDMGRSDGPEGLYQNQAELQIFAELIGVPTAEVSDWELYDDVGFDYKQIEITHLNELPRQVADMEEALGRIGVELQGEVVVLFSEREEMVKYPNAEAFNASIDELRRNLGDTDMVVKDETQSVLVWVNHHGMVYTKDIAAESPDLKDSSF